MKDAQIQGYFAFEENDLIANRDGKLSEKQSKRIREADRSVERLLLALFMLLLTGGTYAVYFTKTTKPILSVEQISNGK